MFFSYDLFEKYMILDVFFLIYMKCFANISASKHKCLFILNKMKLYI